MTEARDPAAQAEVKLAAARSRLLLDRPFLGALTLHLPWQSGSPAWCKTTATDARRVYYNQDYVNALSTAELQFVMAHEALHCALSHFARRQNRLKQRWDLACDYAISPLLIAEGLSPPPGTLYNPEFAGMTAEEIYPCLAEHPEEGPLDDHLYDNESEQGESAGGGSGREQSGGQGGTQQPQRDPEQGGQAGTAEQTAGTQPPPPLSASERDALDGQWQQRLAAAEQHAREAGRLTAPMARMLERLLVHKLSWRALLARYMTAVGRDDYSYQRPSSRREGPAFFPSLRSEQAQVVVAADTSSSITRADLQAFVTEISALKAQVRAHVWLLFCDAQLAPESPWEFPPWAEMRLPESTGGGGGTQFTPVFDWVEREAVAPDLLVYFTDGEGRFPAVPPAYPVVWLIKGNAAVPWGERVQLNE